ncbi:hypothetical protein [Sphingopyxis sp.]|uniref:hypothetical protein n=1 Tax=Sphingopyxis sp. TaxID=1908224 RepID=UPI001D4C179F|nr:hypothetical protein [Sphingopyxis sp.]MBW8296713.1 hypothetical protein [Sphingopyxis sp.]
MTRYICFVLALIAAFWGSHIAHASSGRGCEATIDPSTRLIRLIYDPFDADTASASVEFVVRSKAGRDCAFAVTVSGKGNRLERWLALGGDTLKYDISQQGRNVPNELQFGNDLLPLKRFTGQEDRFEFLFRVRNGEFARSGQYLDQVTVRLFEIGNGPPRQIGRDYVMLVIALVPARAQITLAGSNSQIFGANPAGSIDFGSLSTGVQRHAYLQVRSTSPVLIKLDSRHDGQLRHASFGNKVGAISYRLAIDGRPVDLGTGPAYLVRNPRNGLRADNYQMDFRIGEVTNQVGGLYQDVLTIAVEPN